MSIDDPDPLGTLLAKNKHTQTILDKLHGKNDEGNVNDDFNQNFEKNLSLKVHNHSSASFHGTVITCEQQSTKENIRKLCPNEESDPIVVFDGHSDSTDDEQIELGVRQPSFVSLHGQIIPKGASSLADLQPLIEETPVETINEEAKSSDSDDDEDLQVKIVKQLSAKNKKHWESIGYEPPADLIPLIRTRSHASMDANSHEQTSSTTSLSKFYLNYQLNNEEMIETIEEEVPQQQEVITTQAQIPKRQAPTPIKRKRSGSFGMKLGEASSSSNKMQMIIPEQTSNIELYPIMELEVPRETDKLFGHLNEIVTEPKESPIYQTILTGDNPPKKALPVVRVALRKYAKISLVKGWKADAIFLSKIIDGLPITPIRISKKQKHQKGNDKDVEVKEEEAKIMKKPIKTQKKEASNTNTKRSNSENTLYIKPPTKLNRENDIQIIHMMADEALLRKSLSVKY